MAHALIFSSRLNNWERSSGAHRIATYLRKHDIDVEVVDFAAHWPIDLLREFLKKSVQQDTLFFGFSPFSNYWPNSMVNLAKFMKDTYPHIPRVIGGQNILMTAAEDIDIWIDSYGEEAMLALCKKLAGNSTSGIIFAPEYFGTKKVIKALTSYPSTNLGDYGNIYERRDYLEPWEWTTTEFSRGCKFRCAFCNFPVLGVKDDVSRSQASVEYELKYNYENFGISRYYVADETFNDRLEKISKFANVVDKLNFEPVFSGFIRADLLQNVGMAEELARMNFIGQYYGVETFNKKSGQVVGKGLDPEKVKKLILDTRQIFVKNGKMYRGEISLIVGLPFNTVSEWDDNINWLIENWSTESFKAYPLMVENIDLDDEKTFTNVSKFGKNLQKYGMRNMGSNELKRWQDNNIGYDWRRANWSNNEIVWEHDTMNFFQAHEISAKLADLTLSHFKIGVWDLGLPEVRKQEKIADLQSAINTNYPNVYPDKMTFYPFIAKYIRNKLN